MDTLTVVNDCLETLGEAPLSALDEEHPMAAAALRRLSVANAREQAKGWWFNKEVVTLVPNTDDHFIYLPEDTLSIDPTNPNFDYVQRGRRLYKRFAAASEDKYSFDTSVECKLIRLVPFEDLPSLAQDYVSSVTVRDFQNGYDADNSKRQVAELRVREALVALNAENIRNLDANLLRRTSTAARLNALRPVGSFTRGF